MKISNSQLVKIFNGIGKVREKKLPIKVGFAINKNMDALESVARAYEVERSKILDKYCKKDESGQLKTDGSEYVITDKESYAEEINELLNIENDIQVHTVTIDEIEKCDSDRYDPLSPNELAVLEFMIGE